jgi:hypothetical protein
MNARVLTLYFSETPNINTLNVNNLMLLSAASLPCLSYVLAGSYAVGVDIFEMADPSILYINLQFDDYNNLERVDHFVISTATSYLAVLDGAVIDMVGNAVVPISPLAAMLVSLFTGDIISPTLWSYNLNLNVEPCVMSFVFSEIVNSSTLNTGVLTLQNRQVPTNAVCEACAKLAFPSTADCLACTSSNIARQTLMAVTTSAILNDRFVAFDLTRNDCNTLKYTTTLAVSRDTTWLSFPVTAIDDMFGNHINAINPMSAQKSPQFY